MSKYAPLGDFLRKQRSKLVPMTFEQIERVIGAKLPKSRQYPAWWSNNPHNNVMTQVWLGAGFETEQVDIKSHKVVFRRVHEVPPDSAKPGTQDIREHHPAYGWLEGTVQVAPGVDLTEPADPEWGDHIWADRPWSDENK